jgi:hypothetical protein
MPMPTKQTIGLAVGRLALVGALFVALEIIAVLTMKVDLALTVLAATLWLGWTAVRVSTPLLPHCGRVVAIAAILALAPVDLWLRHSGRVGLEVVRPAWGYPSPAMRESASRGDIELQGCMRPAISPIPTLVALRVTF